MKKDAGNGLSDPALLSGWFHHPGAHRASPHCWVSMRFSFSWLLEQTAITVSIVSSSLPGSKPKFREHVLATNMWQPGSPFGVTLYLCLFPIKTVPASGDWRVVLNTLSSKSWVLILLARWDEGQRIHKIHTQIQSSLFIGDNLSLSLIFSSKTI